jgi:hypothetical protein
MVYIMDNIRIPVVSRYMPPLKEEKQEFRQDSGLESVHLGPHQGTRCLAFYASSEGGNRVLDRTLV